MYVFAASAVIVGRSNSLSLCAPLVLLPCPLLVKLGACSTSPYERGPIVSLSLSLLDQLDLSSPLFSALSSSLHRSRPPPVPPL
ncbi:hypothetical protein IWX50DRAFT_647292 [Phyllosticta citricarpa]|uniref:Secreted protein n=1 Tax=Phyllosticta citricarpa TaxID=55181 RepID=A0ABR1LDV5_9PEZI